MSKYLVSTTEVYRVDNEAEAKELIEAAKTASEYSLVKYTSEHKERKAKGEILDEWERVTLVKRFADEKEPEASVTVMYEVD
jgi:hypothetical protein